MEKKKKKDETHDASDELMNSLRPFWNFLE